MRCCDRKRWSLAQFFALPLDEQNDWLAWELQRSERIGDRIKQAYTPNEKGEVIAEVVMSNLMLTLLLMG